MPDAPKTPEQILADKLTAIDSINRMLDRGTTELRDASGHTVKRDLSALYRRRDELLAEIGGPNAGTMPSTGRIRQVRMIGRKGL